MKGDPMNQSWTAYLRLQAERCQRLSRNCMDLGPARELRLMSEEYFVEASRLEASRLEVLRPRPLPHAHR
jgi:hypothetical protein